ncbi:carbon starvation CstA family protein [Caldalkalibacillus salinus]|uniref:carbon starvation CstA family protein n=1 Tax=Caldalkalibacillus salinus TaxID=2803787 RepID=UPI001920DFB7
MSLLTLLFISGVIFLVAYYTYGTFVEKKLNVEPDRQTPAHEMYDGVDYVPARKPVLLGHHFATIAGGGPIVGPVTAVLFGWIPAVLWIIVGSIFVGGVHDYTALQASIRHKAQSIGTIIKAYIGDRGQVLFLIFSIATLILIVGVFVILVAGTFEAVPQAATASVMFLGVAILFGILVNQIRMNLFGASILGIGAMLLSVWVGLNYPIQLSATVWSLILIGYAYIASVLPVWLLLQPRDYLNSFLLYGMMAGAALGILIANPTLEFPGYTGFYHAELGFLFPILFITIACGAISGFHSLVSSGTTAKQLDSERNGKFIAYGGMLIEGFLAIIAVGSVAYLTQEQLAMTMSDMGGAIGAFAAGIGYFMSHWGIDQTTAVSFTSLVASAFLLTSLDSATRLGRYAVQELTEGRAPVISRNMHMATFVVVLGAAGLALTGTANTVWPLFGSANQMLGAIALLAVTVWLTKLGVKSLFTIIPMVFMFFVTLGALIVLMSKHFVEQNWFLMISAFVLFVLCLFLVVEAWRHLFPPKDKDQTIKV